MLKKFYLQELETFTHIIIEGRGFQGGSDEKMRMWLGREVVVAGLPSLPQGIGHATLSHQASNSIDYFQLCIL